MEEAVLALRSSAIMACFSLDLLLFLQGIAVIDGVVRGEDVLAFLVVDSLFLGRTTVDTQH